MPGPGRVSLPKTGNSRGTGMNSGHRSHFLGAAVISMMLIMGTGCSKNGDQQAAEKGGIEKITDETATAAVKKIRTPMDKARATRDLGDDRLEAMDKALQKQ